VFLRRVAYPNRLLDLQQLFDIQARDISHICNYILQYIMAHFSHLLNNLEQNWLNEENLEKFSKAVDAKGSPLKKCWGFIDGM